MTTNLEVVNSFLRHEENCSGHLMSDGRRLISYQTTIAQWSEDMTHIIVNNTYYSNTTSRHRNLLIRKAHCYLVFVDGIVRGETDLRR